MKAVNCPIRQKRVEFGRDGICERADDSKSADICPVLEESLDLSLNG
jgi:hypothetical protein